MPRKKSAQNKLRLVAYYRFSGGGRQNEQSIEGQCRDCEAYTRSHGYTIQHEYIGRQIADRKTGSNEYVSIDLSANKKPPESDDITSNSEGSTALRLVEAMGVEPMSERSSV